MSEKLRKLVVGILLAWALLCGVRAQAQYNREYFFWVGRSCMMNNDYQEAIRTLNTLLRFDEKAYEGYFLRGIAKYNLDDLLGAEADFSTAIRLNPVYTQAYTYRAITRSRLGNYDDALQDFREAIELRPDLPGPYYSRGVTRLLNQQFREAIDDFDMFIRQETKVADAYICRGLSYLHLKDTTRAYDNFNLAIRTNREDPNGYNRRGGLHLEQEQYEEAEADFNKAIRCDSNYLLSYFNRALVYNATNRPMQALADFDKVIRLDSTNSLTYFNRAMLRTQIGDYNRALEDYDRVALYSPNNVLVYYNRAGVYAQLGELEKAVADYTSAIDLYPDFANAYIYRGRLREVLRDPKGAKRDLETAQRKIAEYRSRLSDSTYSIYADTTQRFDRLLSFDSKFAGGSFDRITGHNGGREEMRLLPLFKFTLMRPDTAAAPNPYRLQRVEDFLARVGDDLLTLSCRESNIAPDSLLAIDRRRAEELKAGEASWITQFERGVSQALIKQYTNSVNTYTAAIDRNPSNPFLYFNRSTTRAEMIDFISSIDNSYQRITIDSDPANRLNNNSKRTYSYDEAVADLNKALKLFPDFAHAYYNRANLQALSGRLPEAFEDYTKAIGLNPSFAEAYYNRGIVQIFMKDTRKGCLDLSKAGELGITEAYEVLKRYAQTQD
ncbi:tetratricopeptide repeat protein [uncultured Alistipes sp.]|uniref:tetratricopeptide repeat protein n=1 Tax=uncultured Alistipes sp. TaxID=538949 RepID=UPI00266C3B00|nr:tetratricopeptide repeat protein [uncultured Alistipes sp.]